MTFGELQSEIDSLVHEPVTFKEIVANSIIIYFFGEPGDDTVRSFFVNPTWRYQVDGRIVVGSYDLQLEEKDFQSKTEYDERLRFLCSLAAPIVGEKLENCHIDSQSSDITMRFSGGHVLRSFCNSAFDDHAWTYRNLPRNMCVDVSPLGVALREAE